MKELIDGLIDELNVLKKHVKNYNQLVNDMRRIYQICVNEPDAITAATESAEIAKKWEAGDE